jgi:hypothetical protein
MDTTPEPPAPDAAALFCPHCQYNLRGTTCVRCPECGKPVDRSILTTSTIPWANRRTIGRFRAFWRTTSMGTFRLRELARNANAPLRLDDALAYRRTVMAHLLVLLAAGLGLSWASSDRSAAFGPWRFYMLSVSGAPSSPPTSGPLPSLLAYYIPPPWSLLVVFAAAWLWLLMATGLHTLFYTPRRLSPDAQRRAVALSWYACAPQLLAWLALPCAIIATLVLVGLAPAGGPASSRILLVLLLVLLLALVWALWLALVFCAWWVPVRLLRPATQCRPRRTWSLALALPLLWLGATALTLILLPLVAFYAAVVYYSLQ